MKIVEPSEMKQLVATCTPTLDEERLIRQSVIKVGMQGCAAMQVIGAPLSMGKGEENGIEVGNMLYHFNIMPEGYEEKVLIKLSGNKITSISVAKRNLFTSRLLVSPLYVFDPKKQIPYK